MPVVIVPRVSVPVVRVAPPPPVVRSVPVAPSRPATPPPAKVQQEIHTTNTATNVALGVATGMAVQNALNNHARAEEEKDVQQISVEAAEIKEVEAAPKLPGQTVDLHKSTVLSDADNAGAPSGPNHTDLLVIGFLMAAICVVAYFVLPKKMRGQRALALLTFIGVVVVFAMGIYKNG